MAEWRRELQSKMVHGKKSKGGGDTETREENLALLAAGKRASQEHKKQTKIAHLPRFELSVTATSEELVQFLEERSTRYEALKSFDIRGRAVVTPPTNIVTYHIVDITLPSEDHPDKSKSILQLLARETDNYIIGFRGTPEIPSADGGFFLYSDIIFPEHFGSSHKLPCDSKYSHHKECIQIFDNILTSMVKSLVGVNADNFNDITDGTRKMMQTSMLIFGECQRMKAPLDFVTTNYTSNLPTKLSRDVIVYMDNWSCLSKASFAFYLGVLEVEMDLSGGKETLHRGRKKVAAAVKKFAQRQCILDLKGDDGCLSLTKLAPNCVRLLKYDEIDIKMLIMRKDRQYRAPFTHIKHTRNDEKRSENE